jgi:redox-sensitive bicupin YhaK (pirin superfamily)
VIAGEFQGLSSPVERGATAPLYLDLTLDAGGRVSVPLPDDHNAFVYVFDGALDIGGQRISKGEIGVLSLGDSVTLDASAQSGRVLVIAGKPLREPVVKYGPFVMNTRQEIEQAVADFQAGRLQ